MKDIIRGVACLLDTDVATRRILANDPQYPTARNATRALRRQGEKLYITPQNLIEFRSLFTRPITANGLGRTADEASAQIRRIERLFPLLPDTPAIYPLWKTLVANHSVVGRQVYDARLVAVMLAHGVTHIPPSTWAISGVTPGRSRFQPSLVPAVIAYRRVSYRSPIPDLAWQLLAMAGHFHGIGIVGIVLLTIALIYREGKRPSKADALSAVGLGVLTAILSCFWWDGVFDHVEGRPAAHAVARPDDLPGVASGDARGTARST